MSIRDSLVDLAINPDNYGNRVITASLPFLNFYGPLHDISSKINTGAAAFATVKELSSIKFTEGLTGDNIEKAFRGFSTVLSLISFNRFGTLSTGIDLFFSLKNGEFYQAAIQGLRFALIVSPVGLELQVAYAAMQIILELRSSYNKYHDGDNIEALSNLALALLRAYQTKPQVVELCSKWSLQPSTFSRPSLLVNKCAGELTPEEVAELENQFQDQEKNILENEVQYVPEDDEETAIREIPEFEGNEYVPEDGEEAAFVDLPLKEIGSAITSEPKSYLVQITLIFNRRLPAHPVEHRKCDKHRNIKHRHHAKNEIRNPQHLHKKHCHPKRRNISKVNRQITHLPVEQNPSGNRRHHTRAHQK